jgi:D-glycero-alpha-D-manno-heptose-7-phosphate kinase
VSSGQAPRASEPRVKARAPTRIDLAGGTLDIWPLYLFLDQAATVNLAIDLYAEARVEMGKARETEGPLRWRVEDEESGREQEADSLAELEGRPGAELAAGLLRVFAPQRSLRISSRSLAPPRSGLGASSALGMAIAGTLNALSGSRYSGPQLIEIVKNVEARVLGTLTGTQDHYAALFGGAGCLWWGPEGVRREPLPLSAEAFERRFLLAYSNQPHRSGANNWEVVKRALDGEAETRRALAAIGRVALSMREALAGKDLEAVATLIGEEWEARRRLAPAVSSPELEQLLAKALAAGADSGKACGAGGGGCLLIAARPSRRAAVESAVVDGGGELVPFRVSEQGLEIVEMLEEGVAGRGGREQRSTEGVP